MRQPKIAYLKCWFLFFVVATIAGAVIGGLVGVVVGAAFQATNRSIEDAKQAITVLAFLVGIPVSYYSFRWAVRTYIVEPLFRKRLLDGDDERERYAPI